MTQANQTEELFGFTEEGLQQEVDKYVNPIQTEDNLEFSSESYVSKAQGKYFDELLGDEEFENDLKLFFKNHDMYKLTDKDIEKKGIPQLANDFVEHIRFQDMNEYVALQDLLFSQRPENEVDPESLRAFGRLDHALEVSEGGGTGFAEGFSDYFRGFASAPSTIATAATLGTGVWTKIGAYFGKKGTQLALKKQLKQMLRDGVSDEVIKKTVKKKFVKDALLSKQTIGATAFETGVGGLHSYSQGETRENIRPGYEYTTSDVIRDALLQGTFAHVLGTGARALDLRSTNKSVDGLLEISKREEALTKSQREAAQNTIVNASTDAVNEQASSISELMAIFEAREKGKKIDLNALPRKLVDRGRQIFDSMIRDPSDAPLTQGLTMDTIRGVTAAGIELRDTLKKYMTPNKRISEAVSDAIAAGDFTTAELTNIKQKYGLSTAELSYLWLADMSKAGQTLAEGKKLKSFFENDFARLSKAGIETPSDREISEIIDPLIDSRFLRDVDNFTIGMMTVQLGTTAANVVSGSFRLGIIDTLDQTWKVLGSSLYGLSKGEAPTKNWLGSMLSNIKGMSWGTTEAKMLEAMLESDIPTTHADLFYNTARMMETASTSKTILSSVARGLNALNSGTDAVLKQMAFYSSIDRQLRGLGNTADNMGNVSDFLKNYTNLNQLPEGVLDQAINDAKKVTYQLDYKGDMSLFGRGARTVQDIHFKVPFLMSKALEIPFPRFLMNHLEAVADYTFVSHTMNLVEKGARTVFPFMSKESRFFDDAYKTTGDRFARSITGTSLVGLGYYNAVANDGDSAYDRDIFAPLAKEIVGDKELLGFAPEDRTSQDYTRSLGTFLAPIFIGDLMARVSMGQRELKYTDADKQVIQEIFGGMTEVGFDLGVVDIFRSIIADGRVDEKAQKFIGDQMALLTYAGKPATDILRNMEYYRSGSPYTKDYYGGGPNEVSNFGERNWFERLYTKGLAYNRAGKFVLDLGGVEGMSDDQRPGPQSEAGSFAVPNYDGFSVYRTGGFSPVTSQFGIATEAPLNDLQKEVQKLGLVTWKLMGEFSNDKNPIVDQAKKQVLSTGVKLRNGKVTQLPMYKQFEAFKKEKLENLGNITYNEIKNPGTRERVLKEFIKTRVNAAEKFAQDVYETRLSNPELYSRELQGYIRHVYEIEQKKLLKSKFSFDDVIKFGMTNTNVGKAFTKKGYSYDNSRDFIMDVDGLMGEINRRNLILTEWLPKFKEANNITLESEFQVER